jgi:hypothetical protein
VIHVIGLAQLGMLSRRRAPAMPRSCGRGRLEGTYRGRGRIRTGDAYCAMPRALGDHRTPGNSELRLPSLRA